MRNPRAIVPVAGFAFLVGAHLGDGFLIRHWIGLHRNVRGHSTHGVDVAPMTRLDGKFRITAHEVGRHRDLRAIGQHGMGVAGKFLDEAEDVIPAAAIQPRRVLAQFIENLIHLEGREDGFDQHGALMLACRQTDLLLRAEKDVVPQAAPPDGSPSSAGRSTGRCRAPAVPWRCGKSRDRNRRSTPTSVRRRRAYDVLRGASHAAARTARPVLSFSLYCFLCCWIRVRRWCAGSHRAD